MGTSAALTSGMSRGEWLEARRKGIGGSDAAAVLGHNPFRGAYAVWADKLGHSDDVDSEATRQGRDLEEYVARRFAAESGKRVCRVNTMLSHPDHPWMLANIDRRVVGERAGLECKTSRDIHMTRYRNGDYPMEYYVQCMHYLAVTGYARWYLAVLVYGTEFKVFEIQRDEDDIRRIIEAERGFWEHNVLTGIAPPADGTRGTDDALKRLYPAAATECRAAEDPGLLIELWNAKQELKRIKELEKALTNRVKAQMGDAERMGSDAHLAVWRNTSRTDYDLTALQRDHPNINLDGYKLIANSRTFTLQENKGA